MRNRTGLVALLVLAAATLLMVFFVLPNMNGKKPAETSTGAPADTAAETTAGDAAETKTADGKQGRAAPAEEATATEAAADGAAEKPAASAGAEVAVEAPSEAAATAGESEATPQAPAEETAEAAATPADPAAGWVVPAFDLLRVEPDGSTVVAGRAEPNTTVEIRSGDTVIATAEAGPSGDFAAVFDQPLAAGDYQLTLEASDGKGASKGSEEVATVSVPKDASGELLAMVSRPGEASRLITLPETAATPSAETSETPAEPTQGEAAALSTETSSETPAADDAATAETPAADATAGKAEVRVAAVELEGERMFVAGNARPGALVRIYADDTLVGEAKADDQGRYVVDGVIDLAVGRHAIRADVMSADGARVELRASVPFDRPEGEQIAVVAQDDTATAEATPALGLVGGGTFDKLRAEAAKALSLLKGLFADGRVPGAEELAAARSATEIALKSLAEFKPGAEEGEVARDMTARASAAAADALARLQALPKEAADVGAALGSIETAVAAALAPAIDTAEGTAGQAQPQQAAATGAEEAAPATEGGTATAPASEAAGAGTAASTDGQAPAAEAQGTAATAQTGAAQPEAAGTDAGSAAPAEEPQQQGGAATAESQQPAAGEPQTVEQAPLKQSKTSVIIRRGDTLWQISRRIYGKGVRYTTIYLANQDQIADPDRILPGQIFGVPSEAVGSDAEAEAEHRKHVHD